jgi:hypothetical protein
MVVWGIGSRQLGERTLLIELAGWGEGDREPDTPEKTYKSLINLRRDLIMIVEWKKMIGPF